MGMSRLVMCVVLIAFLPASVYPAHVGNSVLLNFPNGGFETFPAGGSNDWSWPASDWVWDGNVVYQGSHSARVYRGGGGETDSLYSAYMAVQPSKIYTLSYWLRTRDATWYPSVSIYQYTSEGSQTGIRLTADADVGNGDKDWMQVTYRFQTMPDAARIQVRLFLWTDTSGTFWFDDFEFEEESPALYPFQLGFPVKATGWTFFSSPAIADLDDDGDNELLIGAGSGINGWDERGERLPNFPLPTGDRMLVSQIAVGDLDGDADMEIVAGTRTPVYDGQGRVFVWHHNGDLMAGWPQRVAWNTNASRNDSWVSALALADIDGDTDLEVIAGTTNNAAGDPGADIPIPNLYVWHANGALLEGNWPNWHTSAGIYGSLAAGDLIGDGVSNVIVGRDFYYLYAYAADGTDLPGWPVRTFVDGNEGDYHTDLRVVYESSAPIVADLESDGVMEYIVVGNVKGPGNETTVLNSGLIVLESDGTRKSGWEQAALGSGILAYTTLPRQAPVVADLNEDGKLEIIVATHDGWIRAYTYNKVLLWAFDYAQGETLFASEPVIGDITGDGNMNIVFSTYMPTSASRSSVIGVWGLNVDGSAVPGFPLPFGTFGGQAAPTLGDLDLDGDLEIFVTTRDGRIFGWDTPASYDAAQFPWPTGRYDLQRSAAYAWMKPDFGMTRKFATPTVGSQGDQVTFTLHVASTLPVTQMIYLTDTVPSELTYVPGSLAATHGVVSEVDEQLRWRGVLSETNQVELTYQVIVNTASSQLVRNKVVVQVPGIGFLERTGYFFANGFQFFMPLIFKTASSGSY